MRLIDADRIFKLLKEHKEKETGAFTKGINKGLNIAKCIVKDETQSPTAYNVDKVVEQLEEESKIALEMNESGIYAGLQRAIEIVKTACSSDFKEKTNDDWISVHERFPDTNECILLSFENAEDIEIGKYKVDKDGNGVFYIGDEYQTCLSQDLFVNAWKPLPQPHKGE